MQPYRAADLESGFGSHTVDRHLCQHDGCDEIAESQHRRHATAEEYAAIPEGLVPLDGVAHIAVFTCGDHELDPMCGPEDHQTDPVEQPDPTNADCPKCGAEASTMCTKADGSARRTVHERRAPAPASQMPARCNHVHRADCEGLGACQCGPGDPIPERGPQTEGEPSR